LVISTVATVKVTASQRMQTISALPGDSRLIDTPERPYLPLGTQSSLRLADGGSLPARLCGERRPPEYIAAMTTTAAKILVLGGMFNLLWGYGTGVVMAKVRSTAPETPKYLSLTHVGGLMWAPILFGLALAVAVSDLTAWLVTTAAIAMVSASVLLDLKDLLNWLQGVHDEFVTRPLGFALGGLSGVLSAAGTVVLAVGVIRGL
jgi:hypothetical protein